MIIPRTIQVDLENELFRTGQTKKTMIVYGPRQSGKTTLMREILQKHPEGAEYFNCDYPDVRERFSYERSPQISSLLKGLKLLILDEAQRIANIGLVLKIITDEHPEVRVIATGSSSFDLSNQIKEPLTGRKREFFLYPFSFEELYAGQGILEQKRMVERHLRFGFYPEVSLQGEKEAEASLLEIAGSYLFKDIFAFQELRKPELLTKLLAMLAFQIGSEVSYTELSNRLGADQTVIQRYMHLLEEAFVIFRLGALKRNLRNELAKTRKVYFWDLGIRNAIIRNFNPLTLRDDAGALWENFCVAERQKYLRNHGRYPAAYFWRTYDRKEVDYIEEESGKMIAYECKWNSARQVKIPKSFLEAYPGSEFFGVTPENFGGFLGVGRIF
jgi:predicted AAA+ superfamily ATPase